MPMTSYTDTTPGGPPSGGGPGSGGSGPSGPAGPGGPSGPAGPPPFPGIGGLASKNVDVPEMLVNYNERFKNASPALFRDGTVLQTIGALISKKKPNALLKGGAGVGKTVIVEEIARRIVAKDATVPPQLSGSTIYELPMSSLVAGAGIVGELEERIVKILDFAMDPARDAILFIDEIHVLLSERESTYSKVAQLLKPALARGDLRVIGATTSQEGRAFDNDPAFSRRFQHLVVDELTREQTVEILRISRSSHVAHYQNQVFVSDDMLPVIATIADENSRADAHRPDNALTLMDRAMADTVIGMATAIENAKKAGDTVMLQALQAAGPQQLQEARLKRIAKQLMTGLAKRSEYDEQAIVDGLAPIKGQQAAFDQLLDGIRRDQLEVFPRTKPLAWLLPGPSGVGKTASAKIIAETLTGQPPIILNMTEYAHKNDTAKIMGSPPGYVGSDSNKELPFDTLEGNPHRLIVLDEIEKADREVHRLFMAALDEGFIRTAQGKVIDFSKAIIIATTNAGRDAITKPPTGFVAAGAVSAALSQEELHRALKESFEPEFLGRFTKTIPFLGIDRQLFREIVADGYARQRARIADQQPRLGALLPVALPPADLDRIAQGAYSADLGARPAENAVRAWIEDSLIAAQAAQQAVLSGAHGGLTTAGAPAGDAPAEASPEA